jgi:hypothetical protein
MKVRRVDPQRPDPDGLPTRWGLIIAISAGIGVLVDQPLGPGPGLAAAIAAAAALHKVLAE